MALQQSKAAQQRHAGGRLNPPLMHVVRFQLIY